MAAAFTPEQWGLIEKRIALETTHIFQRLQWGTESNVGKARVAQYVELCEDMLTEATEDPL